MASLPIAFFSGAPPQFERQGTTPSDSQCSSFSSLPNLAKSSTWRFSRSSAEWKTSSNRSLRELSFDISRGKGLKRQESKKIYSTSGGWWTAPMVEARLFGPAMFESSKLRVLVLLAKDDEKKRIQLQEEPRIYTLTHSDVTAQIILTVAREINNSQLGGWYSRLQRDEVLAEWRKTKGVMSLHVHCHISGGDNFLHILIAKLRFYIFQKELPVVLKAFMVGDGELFRKHPELTTAQVWVYFHSSVSEYNRVECWGPLVEAIQRRPIDEKEGQQLPSAACAAACDCCSRHANVVPIPESLRRLQRRQSSS